jgi:DNA-binding response OmpR family regulator
MSAHILLYGTYPTLLQTHTLILERAGFHVAPVDSPTGFRAQLDRDDFDLCIFCSSLTLSERNEAIAGLGTLQPQTPFLILSPGVSEARRHAAPTIIDCLAGPELLLKRIRESLPAPALA